MSFGQSLIVRRSVCEVKNSKLDGEKTGTWVTQKEEEMGD
jgi:hypothetical protein